MFLLKPDWMLLSEWSVEARGPVSGPVTHVCTTTGTLLPRFHLASPIPAMYSALTMCQTLIKTIACIFNRYMHLMRRVC